MSYNYNTGLQPHPLTYSDSHRLLCQESANYLLAMNGIAQTFRDTIVFNDLSASNIRGRVDRLSEVDKSAAHYHAVVVDNLSRHALFCADMKTVRLNVAAKVLDAVDSIAGEFSPYIQSYLRGSVEMAKREATEAKTIAEGKRKFLPHLEKNLIQPILERAKPAGIFSRVLRQKIPVGFGYKVSVAELGVFAAVVAAGYFNMQMQMGESLPCFPEQAPSIPLS